MDQQVSDCPELAAIFEKKRSEGLVDIKFLVENPEKTSIDEVCADVLALYKAVDDRAYKIILHGKRSKLPRD